MRFPKFMRWLMPACLPMYLGGDSDSNSSTNTTNQTDNYALSIDKRSVASDAAVSLTGDGNAVDRSTTSWAQDNTNNSTSMVDSSNRSSTDITQMFDKSVRDNSTNFADSSVRNTDNSTSMVDSSNRSTSFADSSVKTADNSTHFADSSARTDSHNTSMVDSSNRSVSYSTTDYGSVGKALDGMGMMGSKALDFAAIGINGSVDSLKYIADMNSKSVSAAFDMTKAAGANSLGNNAAVLGFASSAIKETAAAFAEAKDGGQSKMVTYAIVAVAAVGVAYALRA